MIHARLSPSNSRWVYCPGSVREESVYTDVSSAVAEDGTYTHSILENCLKSDIKHYEVKSIDKKEIERAERVNIALDYIHARYKELSEQYPDSIVTIESEKKVYPDPDFCNRDDWWGTCDVIIKVTSKNSNLLFAEVIDYKDGFVEVDVNNNPQLMTYLYFETCQSLMSVHDLKITIIQPKNKNSIRSQEVNPISLLLEIKKLEIAAYKTDEENAKLFSGDHCQYCKHLWNCSEFKSTNKKEIDDINNIDFNLFIRFVDDLENINESELSTLLDLEFVFNDLFEKIKNEAMRRLKNDKYIPGFYVGKTPRRNVWSKTTQEIEEELKKIRLLKKDIYSQKLISPAQALELKLTDKQKSLINLLIKKKEGREVIKKNNKLSVEKLFIDINQKIGK